MTLRGSPGMEPGLAWARATASTFPNSMSMQVKGCPKWRVSWVMLSEGLVEGVRAWLLTRSQHNKGYAVRAVSTARRQSLVGCLRPFRLVACLVGSPREGAQRPDGRSWSLLWQRWLHSTIAAYPAQVSWRHSLRAAITFRPSRLL